MKYKIRQEIIYTKKGNALLFNQLFFQFLSVLSDFFSHYLLIGHKGDEKGHKKAMKNAMKKAVKNAIKRTVKRYEEVTGAKINFNNCESLVKKGVSLLD